MLVIGDDHGPDDLAGVMGGERSGVSEATTDMFLEVAIFDPTSVAATGRKLGLQSDARYRFERGLDQTSPFWGAEVATRLVQERSEEHTSETPVTNANLVCRLLLEKKKTEQSYHNRYAPS